MKFNLKLVPEPQIVLQALSDVAAAIYTSEDVLHMEDGPKLTEIIDTACFLWRIHDDLAQAVLNRGL